MSSRGMCWKGCSICWASSSQACEGGPAGQGRQVVRMHGSLPGKAGGTRQAISTHQQQHRHHQDANNTPKVWLLDPQPKWQRQQPIDYKTRAAGNQEASQQGSQRVSKSPWHDAQPAERWPAIQADVAAQATHWTPRTCKSAVGTCSRTDHRQSHDPSLTRRGSSRAAWPGSGCAVRRRPPSRWLGWLCPWPGTGLWSAPHWCAAA